MARTAPADPPDGAAFDARRAAWQAYRATPWGRLRERVVAHTLDLVCGEGEALRVLDVGSGDGADAVHLAGRGHTVTVLDPAPLLLADAVDAAAAQGLADRVVAVAGGIDDLPAVEGYGDFDLVLCHNVLQYRADVRRSVGAVVAAAAPAALVSLLCPNPAMELLTAVVQGRSPAAALSALDAPTSYSQVFDRQVAAVPVETAERALVGAGCELLHRFGIRCVTDLLRHRQPDDDTWEALEALEVTLSTREPFLRTARFWQLVGRTF